MDINTTKDGTSVRIALVGRLDTNTAPELEHAVKENMEGISDLTIDLTDVQYVSSAGLRVFLFAHKEITRAGGSFTICHANEYIMDVFEATGFTDVLNIEQ